MGVLMTMIARAADGLPLAASVQDEDHSGRGILEYQNQAKMLFKKLTPQSPARCTIETGYYLFHYIIDNGVCYLVLCEKTYSKTLAFAFLEDLSNEFREQYGHKVNVVARPYSFIQFDTYIQKAKKSFTDSRARRNLSALNSELKDVQRIMIENIDDVLQRGAAISELEGKAQGLSVMAQKYRKDAQQLNLYSTLAKVAAGGIVILVIILYFWVF